MRIAPSAGLCLCVVLAAASVARATCDPTTDPDKTDIANARAAVAANCNCAGATSHGAYVSCAVQQANLTLVNKGCAGTVKRCASRSTCGKPAGAVTCCVTKTTGTKCKIKRDAAHCQAPPGATACVGGFTSCCDACGMAGCATSSTTTTTTSTTTTTTGPPCGNNVIDAGEQCDGTALPVQCSGFACELPGRLNQCRCCGIDYCSPTEGITACCGEGTYPVLCAFDEPSHPCYYCGVGGVCGAFPPDGTPNRDCCDGAVCQKVVLDVVYRLVCCMPVGKTCAGDTDCCTDFCDVVTSTCQCAPAGHACFLATDFCCSGTCSSGTCS